MPLTLQQNTPPSDKDHEIEYKLLRKLDTANILRIHGRCVDECHPSISICAKCLGLSVPDLVKLHQWTDAELQAIKVNQQRWEEVVEMTNAAIAASKKSSRHRKKKAPAERIDSADGRYLCTMHVTLLGAALTHMG